MARPSSFALAILLAVASLSPPRAAEAQLPRDTVRVTIVYTGRSLGALGARRAQEEHELLTQQAATEGQPFKLVSHLAWRTPGIVVFFSGEEPRGDELPWIIAQRAEAERIDTVRALVSANVLLLQDPWRPQPDLLAMLDQNPRRSTDFPDLVPTRVRVSRLRTPDDYRVYIVEQPGAVWPSDADAWGAGEMNRIDVLDSRLFELPLNLGELGPRATLVTSMAAAARARGSAVITVDLGHQESDIELSRAERARLNQLALARLGYGTLVPYAFELSLGAAALGEITRETPGVVLLAANVRTKDSSVFVPSRIIEANGMRVGLIGLVNLRARDGLPRARLGDFIFEAPAIAARREVARLRAAGVDAIVALSNMDPLDNAALGDEVPGIDAIVADMPVRWAPEAAQVRVELPDRPFARPGPPALIARSAANGLSVGQLDLEFRRSVRSRAATDAARTDPGTIARSGALHLSAVSHRIAAVTDQIPADTALVREITGRATLNRRPRGELMFPAFVNLADRHPELREVDAVTRQGRMSKAMWEAFMARLVRLRGQTEVAVIRRLEQFPPLIGKLHENEIDEWLWTEDQIVLLDITGADLRAALREDVRGELATSGFDAVAGTVQGHKIDDQTYYRMATSDVLFEGARFKSLSRGRRVRRTFVQDADGTLEPMRGAQPLAIRDLVYGELKRIRARAKGDEQIDAVAALIAPDQPYVSLLSFIFDRPTLWASANQVTTQGDYGAVPDARVTARNVWMAGFTGRVLMTHERATTATDVGLSLAYSRQGIFSAGREDVSTLTNDIRLDVTLRPSRRVATAGEPHLFVRGLLNTEFTPTIDITSGRDNNRKMAVRASGGYLLMPGPVIRRAELALAIENDFGRPNLQYGFQSVAQFEWRLGAVPGISSITGVTYRLRNDITYLFPSAADNASHLGLRENMVHELLIPLVDELSLSVAADLYLFQGKVPQTSKPGFSAQLRVGITYDRLWKPRYQPFL